MKAAGQGHASVKELPDPNAWEQARLAIFHKL